MRKRLNFSAASGYGKGGENYPFCFGKVKYSFERGKK